MTTTWRKEITDALEAAGESWGDVEAWTTTLPLSAALAWLDATDAASTTTIVELRPDEPWPMHIIACPICGRLTTRVICTQCARLPG